MRVWIPTIEWGTAGEQVDELAVETLLCLPIDRKKRPPRSQNDHLQRVADKLSLQQQNQELLRELIANLQGIGARWEVVEAVAQFDWEWLLQNWMLYPVKQKTRRNRIHSIPQGKTSSKKELIRDFLLEPELPEFAPTLYHLTQGQ